MDNLPTVIDLDAYRRNEGIKPYLRVLPDSNVSIENFYPKSKLEKPRKLARLALTKCLPALTGKPVSYGMKPEESLTGIASTAELAEVAGGPDLHVVVADSADN